jgi:NAD(P)-dependent dehydrogenase (short-subunit alcohol dehydrogenase family)
LVSRTDLFLGKPENEKVFMSTVPLGRGTKPSDVANTCCFLASDEASFLTGNAVEVDGGRCV